MKINKQTSSMVNFFSKRKIPSQVSSCEVYVVDILTHADPMLPFYKSQ